MSDISLIILSAGNSSRFEYNVKKQWLRIDELPLWKFVTQNLATIYSFDKIVITAHLDEVNYMLQYAENEHIIVGGDTRQDSLRNALEHINTPYVMVSDVARCCIPSDVILALINSKQIADCIVPYLPTVDTTILGSTKVNREDIKLIQTPQLSKTALLKQALKTDEQFTDDSSAMSAIGASIHYILGSTKSAKLTHAQDLPILKCLQKPSTKQFCGFGYDVHGFEPNKTMVLGGVTIDSPFGFKAHSDGDVLIHSIIDAILGAISAGDIGEFFPDTDPKYKNANSQELLKTIVRFAKNVGYEIINIDVSIIAEAPKITPYKIAIKQSLAQLLQIPPYAINIKATTNEKMGFIGRREGIAVHSVANMQFYDWTQKEQL